MMGFLLGVGIVIISGMLGVLLDVVGGVKNPPIYWAVGMVGGMLAMVAILSPYIF